MTKKVYRELFPNDIENLIRRETAAFKEYDIPCTFVFSVVKNTKHRPFRETIHKLTINYKRVELVKKENGKYGFNDDIIKELIDYFFELFKKTPIYNIYF